MIERREKRERPGIQGGDIDSHGVFLQKGDSDGWVWDMKGGPPEMSNNDFCHVEVENWNGTHK